MALGLLVTFVSAKLGTAMSFRFKFVKTGDISLSDRFLTVETLVSDSSYFAELDCLSEQLQFGQSLC